MSSEEMRVSTEKARWFAFVLCALAAVAAACQSPPDLAAASACVGSGIVSSKRATAPDGSEVAAEIVQNGCADCSRSSRAGAAPGSPCAAASVCQEFCCNCLNLKEKLRYRARVCSAGHCADAQAACASARSSIEPDVCAGP
jgi:hypothetical protein